MVNIAVDGPAGAGKSSVSKEIAARLGIIYIDTGAMYRAAALYAIERGIEITRENMMGCLENIDIDICYDERGQRIYLNGKDVSERIREKDVSIGSSDVAVIPEVRLKLVELQRKLAKKASVIMDGRDIGTYVLPKAEVKIYLTASSEERAKRRCLELEQKGIKADFDEVKRDIEYRDRQDSQREFAPLKKADDAVLVDSSNMGFSEVAERIIEIIKNKIGLED